MSAIPAIPYRSHIGIACLTAGLTALNLADATAATIRVPADYATIEEAIANAIADDTILVSAGTYEVDATIAIPLTLRSESGADETILSGMGQHRMLDIAADATIDGFIFEDGGDGGSEAANDFFGGAIRVLPPDIDVRIENCVFRFNKAGAGGGVYSRARTEVVNCEFIENGNGSMFPDSSRGGGLWVDNDTLVDNCTFIRNRSASGAGMRRMGPTTVRNSTFEENTCNGHGGGIGMSVNSEPITIENCTFVDNYGSRGGGVYLVGNAIMTVRDCEFRDNIGGLGGGGMNVAGAGEFVLENTTFIDNATTTGAAAGGGALLLARLDGGATVRRCFFRGNVAPTLISSRGGGAVWMNESADAVSPRFFDCTFVDNTARLGAAVLIVWNGSGPDQPVFERCIFGYNVGQTTIACSGANSPRYLVQCSIFTSNESNVICGLEGADVFVIDEDAENQIFCDVNHDSLCADSPAWQSGCGPMGGLLDCGGCITPVESVTWSAVKSRFSQ